MMLLLKLVPEYYDSAMMLNNHTCTPFHCWTVNLNTTQIFLKNGLDLKYPDTNAPMPWPNHPTGQCMKSMGVWTSSSSINIYILRRASNV